MNESGRQLSAYARYFKIAPQHILVAYDELDFPAGVMRLRFGGGAGGHNGVRDVIRCLGDEFWRLRIGIGRPADKAQVTPFVLSPPTRGEKDKIAPCLEDAANLLDDLAAGNFEKALTHLHSDPRTNNHGI